MDPPQSNQVDRSLKNLSEEESKLVEEIERLKVDLKKIEEKLIATITKLNALRRAIRDYPLDQIQDEELLIAMAAAIGDYDDHEPLSTGKSG